MMPFQIARGVARSRYEAELRSAAGVALMGLGLGIAVDPWFFLVSGICAGFLLFEALYGHHGTESLVDRPQSRNSSGRISKVATRERGSGRPPEPCRGIAPAGPWRVVTDPLSEQMRHPPCGDVWTIIDPRDQVVFTGTKQDCEDWLDYQDNNP